jgi:hypothetical protein
LLTGKLKPKPARPQRSWPLPEDGADASAHRHQARPAAPARPCPLRREHAPTRRRLFPAGRITFLAS